MYFSYSFESMCNFDSPDGLMCVFCAESMQIYTGDSVNQLYSTDRREGEKKVDIKFAALPVDAYVHVHVFCWITR